MKLLNGAELRDFIKERQAKQVRALRQSWRVFPKLVIFYHSKSQVVETYMRLKRQYGEDILVDVEARYVEIGNLKEEIHRANVDEAVHGIIVQLPLETVEGGRVEGDELREILNVIAPEKDVDGLGEGCIFDPATAQAINWLLTGYNVDLSRKKIAIVGRGLLVGAPLYRMWQHSGYDVEIFGRSSGDLSGILPEFDIVVTATGVPGLISSEMLKKNAVVVDAGTASEGGVIKGDVADEVRERRGDVTITPKIGGVGPLTVAALIDNVIISARRVADEKGQQDL